MTTKAAGCGFQTTAPYLSDGSNKIVDVGVKSKDGKPVIVQTAVPCTEEDWRKEETIRCYDSVKWEEHLNRKK